MVIKKGGVLVRFPIINKTIRQILAEKASENSDKTLLKYYDKNISYGFIDQHTNKVAQGLLKNGVKKGDHIAIILPNCPEYLYLIFAIAKIGAVGVPINTAAKGELLNYYIEQSDSKWIIVHQDFTESLQKSLENINRINGYIVLEEETKRNVHSDSSCGFKKVIPYQSLEEHSCSDPVKVHVNPTDDFLIMYTSGTTGRSKGVVLPQAHSINFGQNAVKNYGYNESDIMYTCLPLFHSNALFASFFSAFMANGTVVLSSRFSASKFWDEIVATGATQFNSLGAMTNFIIKTFDEKRHSKHCVRQCMIVPSLSTEMAHFFEKRFKIKITSLFAMTENFPITVYGPTDPIEKIESAGKATEYATVRVVDANGSLLPPGKVGEIIYRPIDNGIMMSCYYKMPKETIKTVADGWYYTGDLGFMDKDGYLYFVDRKKEAIRRRGENISAYELEMILSKHEKIIEVAAIPVPSEFSEDEVMVYVVLKDGIEMKPEDLIYYCKEVMPYYMVPRYVEFVGKLPKTPTEKIEKYKLISYGKENIDVIWDREKHGIEIKRDPPSQ